MEPLTDATARPQADPLVGLLLDGRYRLDEALARGGMATVYRATDARLDRDVAVKVMHRALADDPDFVARFTREARAAARLSSPEVVSVHDQGTDPGTGLAYLVMEHVRGGTLRDLLRAQGAQTPVRALALLEPVLRALAAAHREGLVHRDVKPENVLLADDGRVKVADFGLARAVEASSLTSMSTMLGTAAYMAPEQVERPDAADVRADPRTDVYAAGIVLYELLTGTPPYGGESSVAVAYRHVHDDVPAPSAAVPGLPPLLDDLVRTATSRDPAGRPADAADLLGLVQAVRSELASSDPEAAAPDRAPADPLITERLSRATPTLALSRPEPEADDGADEAPAAPAPAPRRRRGRLAALLVAVAAVLALSTGWWFGARTVAVPDVLRVAQDTAEQRLVAAGFDVGDVELAFSEDVPAGSVLEQQPAGRARPGAVVELVVSRGPDRRPLPELVGLTQEVAAERVEAAGLRVGTVTRAFSDEPVGEVVAMGAPAGTRLRPGSPVNLTVSKGVELLPVPSVVGDPQDEGAAALEAAGFAVRVEEVFSESVPRGRVVAQDPAGGELRRGGTVSLQVSRGPERIAVPDLSGMTDREAKAALQARGLKGRGVQPPLFGGDRVSRQDPSAGERVKRGATVTYLLT